MSGDTKDKDIGSSTNRNTKVTQVVIEEIINVEEVEVLIDQEL